MRRLVLRHRQLRMQVRRVMRWQRSQVRLPELLCCPVVVVRMLLRRRLVLQLAKQVGQQQLRVRQQVLRWSEVEDRWMRWERLQVRL